MNFVADESVDAAVASLLREDGHRVTCVWELAPGMADADVLDLANAEEAVLITADKDFGELVFRMQRAHCGVLLLRLPGISPTDKATTIVQLVRVNGERMKGAFTVATRNLVRIRPASF